MNKTIRNYSFAHRDKNTLDSVECNGIEYSIPAGIGSSYWAILKTLFSKIEQPVYYEELTSSVKEYMLDRDPDRWLRYCNKNIVTVYVKSKKTTICKPSKHWKQRIITNALTLSRNGGNSPYCLRLLENGFILKKEYDSDRKPYFIIRKVPNNTSNNG